MSSITNRIKDFLWAIVFAGSAAAVLRFGLGLGAATGLNDATPWGLWIAFKLCFVALAGGGFTLAGMVYIFHLETFRPILRRAILLALLGYGSFIVSLLFDLGLPWHIYMPIIHWQHHSVMFEIAWCVLLYFSVLVMEFGPVILEHLWFQHPLFQKIAHILHLFVIPLVIAGIILSTLHQSSLGSLFLIMPQRVHPLWYSPWIPVLFFTSAIAAGMMGLIVEGFLAERFGHNLRFDLLERLGKIGGFTLWLYLAIRLGDLAWRRVLPTALDGSWQSLLFGLEILLFGILPASLLLTPKIRSSRAGLLTCAILAMAGVLSQRMSLSMITIWQAESARYIPSILEIIIAFAIPAAAALLYLLFVENLAVFSENVPRNIEAAPARPQFNPGSNAFSRPGLRDQIILRSSIAVMMIALTIAALPTWTASGQIESHAQVQSAKGWEHLEIDGNSNEIAVQFPHGAHQERLTELLGSSESACLTCHHLNKPDDVGTGCWNCHQDYYAPASIFDHTIHTRSLGGNHACIECHQGEHRAETAVACVECHKSMTPTTGKVSFSYLAPGYQDAMHGMCVTCHAERAITLDKPDLAACTTCHFSQSADTEFTQQSFPQMILNNQSQ